jgi:hypothetical protein
LIILTPFRLHFLLHPIEEAQPLLVTLLVKAKFNTLVVLVKSVLKGSLVVYQVVWAKL